MRLTLAAALALLIVSGAGHELRAAAANACKDCTDQRTRCTKNYPGPTCKTDYDICMKSCAKK